MAMDNEVVIHVRAKDDTDRVFDAVRTKAKKLGDDVTLKIKAEDKTEAAFKSAERRAKSLDDDVNVEIKADDKTGPAFDSVKRKAKTLGDDIGKNTGKKIGEDWAQGLINSFTNVTPAMVKTGIAAAAIMAPQIGATIAGAVVGGAGFMGVAGGMLIAAQDSRVKVAARTLGEQVSNSLKGAATSFVPASVEAIEKVKLGWRTMLPTIQNIFTQSAKFVGPLTDSLIKMGSRVLEGVEVAVGRAGPVMEAFGYLFEEVGDAVGDLFEQVSEDADIGAVAIQDFGDILGALIRDFGGLTHELSEVKEEWEMWQEAFRKSDAWLEDHISWLDVTADGYEKGSEAAKLYREGVIGAAGSSNDYTNYLKELNKVQEETIAGTEKHTEALQNLAHEMQNQTDPLFTLFDLQVKVAKAQAEYNKQVKEGGENSPKAQKALAEMGRAAFELNTALGEAADGFNGRLTPAMRTALRNAKLSDAQIDALERSLIKSRDAAEKWEGSFEQVFRVREIITSSGETIYAGGGGRQAPIRDRGASGKIKGSASGGMSGGRTWVGEHGPELLDLPPGSQVHSNPDSRRLATAGSTDGTGAGGPVTIYLTVDGQTIATAVLPSLQKLNRDSYAGDVTRMFPATR
jgi:hypothetical protein